MDGYLRIDIPGLTELKELIMATKDELQARLDGISGQLQTAADGLAADIQALKDQVAAAGNVDLDFSAVDARVAQLQGLDAQNPTPTPVPPADNT